MRQVSKFEKKFGKYAIPNLTTIMILTYAIGYVLYYFYTPILTYLTLDPYAILHGEVWRLFTWVLMPPADDGSLVSFIMLYFYWTIGRTLEQVWGDYRYNIYMFLGFLFTVIGSFVAYFYAYAFYFEKWGLVYPENARIIFHYAGLYYNTYYVTLSIFLAFAVTFPDTHVLLMFFIPFKVKWLAIFYAIVAGFQFLQTRIVEFATSDGYGKFLDLSIFERCVILFSLLNFLLFFFTALKRVKVYPKNVVRKMAYREKAQRPLRGKSLHKCAICGRTEEDGTELEFRFCSRCNGDYEYCQEHLFTHEHIN